MLRKPDTIPAGDTIITDPVLEPYFITKSQTGGYVVYERVTRGENDTEYFKTICYPATFNHALRTVAVEKLNNNSTKHFDTVKGYIKEWKEIQRSFLTMTSIGE